MRRRIPGCSLGAPWVLPGRIPGPDRWPGLLATLYWLEAALTWLHFVRDRQPAGNLWRNMTMAWKTPRIVEISLAMEINSYACAEIG